MPIKLNSLKLDKARFVKLNSTESEILCFIESFSLFWDIGFENQDIFSSFEIYREYILIAIGFCEVFILPNGLPNYKAKSISYEKLPDNNDFETIYNDALSFIANRLSLTNEELTNEILTNF